MGSEHAARTRGIRFGQMRRRACRLKAKPGKDEPANPAERKGMAGAHSVVVGSGMRRDGDAQ